MGPIELFKDATLAGPQADIELPVDAMGAVLHVADATGPCTVQLQRWDRGEWRTVEGAQVRGSASRSQPFAIAAGKVRAYVLGDDIAVHGAWLLNVDTPTSSHAV